MYTVENIQNFNDEIVPDISLEDLEGYMYDDDIFGNDDEYDSDMILQDLDDGEFFSDINVETENMSETESEDESELYESGHIQEIPQWLREVFQHIDNEIEHNRRLLFEEDIFNRPADGA